MVTAAQDDLALGHLCPDERRPGDIRSRDQARPAAYRHDANGRRICMSDWAACGTAADKRDRAAAAPTLLIVKTRARPS